MCEHCLYRVSSEEIKSLYHHSYCELVYFSAVEATKLTIELLNSVMEIHPVARPAHQSTAPSVFTIPIRITVAKVSIRRILII